MDEIEPTRIKKINFGLLGPEDMLRLATIECRDPFLRYTTDHVLHPALGVDNGTDQCATCENHIHDCFGHYGFIRLELPVFHVGFLAYIIRILRCICKTCGRLLLPENRINQYVARYQNPKGLAFSQRKALFIKVFTEASRVYLCPHCQAINGKVSKLRATTLRIVHQPSAKHLKQLPRGKNGNVIPNYGEASLFHPSLVTSSSAIVQDLTPDIVRALFCKIPTNDVIALDMEPSARPEHMILTHVHVPPKVVRPTPPAFASGSTRHDDITLALNDILSWCDEIRRHRLRGGTTQKYFELWDTLQVSVSRLIDDKLPNFPRVVRDKFSGQLKSYVARLKGKGGRFRNTLCGKRVNFSGRSVISPDPNLEINELAVPMQIAQKLSFPQRVTAQNIHTCRELVRRGPEVYPGANFVVFAATGEKKHLRHARTDRSFTATRLQIGDIVERHIVNGDAIIFNRQPSLHRLSMMCHIARVLPYRTFRFNECVCQPYNADFDGDEMNIHVPQTVEARAEAIALMSATQNLFSARNGCPIIAPLQDFLTGGFLLTRRDTFLSRAEIAQILAYFVKGSSHSLPVPAILRPKELWSGKQVIPLLLGSVGSTTSRIDKRTTCGLNFTSSAKFGLSHQEQMLTANDDIVRFRNNELLSGQLEKGIMGSGDRAKNGYFFHVKKHYGIEYAAACMSRFSRLTSRFLMQRGFSIGIDDVTPNEKLADSAQSIVQEGFAQAQELIRVYNNGELPRHTGCTIEETLEKEIKRVLSDVRDRCGRQCIDSLPSTNAPLIMAQCGSKGSVVNISQMIVCVGQQIVNERRIDDHFLHRSTPHFPQFSRDALARGFVKNSFYSGLTPVEFVFHTMAGREGLVQSSIKTAQTGYLGRRIMKVLEDLTVHYDHTVRNADGCVVQLRYGEDSLDPLKIDPEHHPLDLQREWDTHVVSRLSDKASDETAQLASMLQANIESRRFQVMSKNFIHSLVAFCHDRFCCKSILHVSPEAFEIFLKNILVRFMSMMCEPGTPCGVVSAQSLSEPTTQMTLRTFHFAGVAGMSVTQGVPRIEEIMDARRSISTPFVTLILRDASSADIASSIKESIERTRLQDITQSICQIVSLAGIKIRLNFCAESLKQRINELSLEMIAHAILKSPKASRFGITQSKISLVPEETSIDIAFMDCDASTNIDEGVENMAAYLKDVVVAGIPSCVRALIRNTADSSSVPVYEIIVETDDLNSLIALDGVDAKRSKCNHVASIESTLGIEAARSVIISEILAVMKVYALTVDIRHVMLLADAMTSRGKVLGTTNSGLSKDRDSVLKLASFERTQEHIFNAAAHSRCDKYLGVSENIMLGMTAKIGTNLFGLLDERRYHSRAQATSQKDSLGAFWESVKQKFQL